MRMTGSLVKGAGLFLAITFGALTMAGCLGGGQRGKAKQIVVDDTGGANPYLWRASLDTMGAMPLISADPLGGTIIYDWKSFASAPNERIKAVIYVLDSRLRADGIKVAVFRQIQENGVWQDAETDPDTGRQLESAILMRARTLKASEFD